MNAMLVLLIGAAVLVVGYIFYGGWLAKQWGVNADRVTPAHEFEDGVDYVPAKPYVVLGHHFSSIAGAGPINGPIQAAVFGWVPVLLWVLIGGIFFGAMHDFGALFASLRHKGQTLASVIQENIDDTAKKLFCIFAYLTLILVVAAFASIVAGTFAVVPNADGVVEMTSTNLANSRTAMISVLFIVAAVIWGVALRGRSIPGPVNIALAIVVIVAVVAIGYSFPVFELNNFTWMWIVGAYILVASIAPVWILLQPRDYLSSYLLYGMIALALVGIIGAGVTGAATNLDIPAFTGFTAVKGDSKVATTGFLPSHAARFRASIAWWLRARRPSSSTMKAKRSPSPMAACCSSAWSPLFRCVPLRSCSMAIWTAPTRRPRRFSQAASPRCSAASPAFLAPRTSHTRC